jgi:hypothetical protein
MLKSASYFAFCRDNNLINELMKSTVALGSTINIAILPRPSQQKYIEDGNWTLTFDIECSETGEQA